MNDAIAGTAIQVNCGLLGVSPPRVEDAPASDFATRTTMAALSSDGQTLIVNAAHDFSELDIWLAVSHEMRHKWQIETGWSLDGYRVNDGDTIRKNSVFAPSVLWRK